MPGSDTIRSPTGVKVIQGNFTDPPYPPGAKLVGRNNYEDNHKANNAVTDQLISRSIETQKETDASNEKEESSMNIVAPKTVASMMAHPCEIENMITLPVDYITVEVEQHKLIKNSCEAARESINAHMGKTWKRITRDPHFSTHASSVNIETVGPKRLFQETIIEKDD